MTETPDELAERYVEICLQKWTALQLPVSALASAMIARGLSLATHGEGVETVAEGLERMAEVLRGLEDPGVARSC